MNRSVYSAKPSPDEARHELPQLPYPLNALEPYISKATLEFHHGKHHAAYVKKLNQLIHKTEFAHATLEEIVRHAPPGAIFNNAGQAWNHAFYWESLSPNRQQPARELAQAIDQSFGSLDKLRMEFHQRATVIFGSGWMWLVKNADGSLALQQTANAETPLRTGLVPLLTCDAWEHAYYLDYRNERERYLDAFWKIINWEAVGERYHQG